MGLFLSAIYRVAIRPRVRAAVQAIAQEKRGRAPVNDYRGDGCQARPVLDGECDRQCRPEVRTIGSFYPIREPIQCTARRSLCFALAALVAFM